MCTNSNNGDNSNRRRTHQEMMLQSSSSTAYQSTKVPMATIYSSGSDTQGNRAVMGESSGIFRAHTIRLVALILAVALLATSIISANYNRGSKLKDLSDTVMSLTEELKKLDEANKKKEQDLEALEKELEDKKIELSWEEQHVQDAKEGQEMMYKTMAEEIKREQEIITETTKATSHFAQANHKAERLLMKEHDENAQLKVALAHALEELASERAKLPPAPGSGATGGSASLQHQGDHTRDVNKGPHRLKVLKDDGKDLDTKVRERRLRGQNPWQPGDNVEILEEEDHEGKIALRPGIVTELNQDGTYNIVKLEASIVKNHLTPSQFQTYHTYPPGTAAMFEEKQNMYVPITIVQFIKGSARIGFELHGKYQYTLDSDEKQEVKTCTAMRIHRYAAEGEVVGADKLNLKSIS